MLVLPPAFDADKKYPLFVVIHGGPHSMWRDQFVLRWNYHLLAAPGYVVLLTNYTGSTGFGEKFAQAIQGDPLKTPGDEINQAADEAIKRFAFIDGSQQCRRRELRWPSFQLAASEHDALSVSHQPRRPDQSGIPIRDERYRLWPRSHEWGPPWEQGAVWRQQNPISLRRALQDAGAGDSG